MSDDVKGQLVALLPRLRRFAYGLTGSVDEGDDLVQAACVRALSSLDQWQPGTRLDSWMFRIIQNLRIDGFRARRTRGEQVDPDVLADLAGEDGRRTTEAALTLDRVRRIVGELPEDQRTVLMLVAVDGLSYQEAAAVLDVPIGTVTSRLARARQRIGARLEAPAPASVAGNPVR
ncbi:MAG: RNA polymerase sigma factor [Rhodospirillales bacterium]